MAEKMNVLVLSADSYRRDNLTIHGGTHVRTPNIDALAQQSAVFEQAYSGSYPTIPNRTDIFTGTWTFPNKDWAPLDPEAVTLSETISAAGAVTHLEFDCPHLVKGGYNFERGFHSWNWVRGQENDNYAPRALVDSITPPGDSMKYRKPVIHIQQHMANQVVRKRERDEDYSMAVVARNTIEMLRHLKSAKQFFMWVDMFDPHEPFDPPKHYFDMYSPGYRGILYKLPVYGKCSCYSKPELRAIRAAYLGEATMVDHWIGRILASLKDVGLDETTTVIFTSDHGLAYGDHGYTGKNTFPVFTNVARIPLLISTPEMRKKNISRKIKELVQPVDFMPTILETMGIKPLKRWNGEGVSLLPLVKGKSMKTRDAAFTGAPAALLPNRPGSHLRVSTKKWVLLYPPVIGGKQEKPMLFDVVKDPGETKSVIRNNMNTARALYVKYVKFFKTYNKTGEGIPVPPPESYF